MSAQPGEGRIKQGVFLQVYCYRSMQFAVQPLMSDPSGVVPNLVACN